MRRQLLRQLRSAAAAVGPQQQPAQQLRGVAVTGPRGGVGSAAATAGGRTRSAQQSRHAGAMPALAEDAARGSYFQAQNVRVELAEPSGYRNVDGERIDDGRYARFITEVSRLVPADRIITDSVRKFAYGTDASFYRLVPQVVVKVASEAEVQRILPLALAHRTPVTFRAAGTSLSGQAITDSVMLKLSHTGRAFRNYKIEARHARPLARRTPAARTCDCVCAT